MLRFLVVDDEPAIGRSLARWLEKTFEGPDVRLVTGNDEALKALESFAPTLIITDFYHHDGTGIELLTHLRTDPKTRHVPVVIASATTYRMELDHYRAGFNAVLSKPFSYDQFIDAVSRLLSLSVDPDIAILHIGQESPGLDYKESVDLHSKAGRAALAKDVIAMANYGGGTIVIGVAEVRPGEFAPTGISQSLQLELEITRLSKALREFLDPPVPIQVKNIRDGSRLFSLLRIPGADDVPVLAGTQNEQAGLYLGRLYTRNSAAESAEVRTADELRTLIQRFRDKAAG